MTLTFEDFPPGHFGRFGPRRVTREEMLAFAAEFDPQPMHLDEEAAKRSMLQGLSASGWHLCSIMMRMMCDGYIGRTASLGSPGVNELRWLAPLRPGDDLMLDVDVTEARLSRSRPETGIVTFKAVVRNAAGTVEGAVSVVAPAEILSAFGTEEAVARAVDLTARDISRDLGFQEPQPPKAFTT